MMQRAGHSAGKLFRKTVTDLKVLKFTIFFCFIVVSASLLAEYISLCNGLIEP